MIRNREQMIFIPIERKTRRYAKDKELVHTKYFRISLYKIRELHTTLKIKTIYIYTHNASTQNVSNLIV